MRDAFTLKPVKPKAEVKYLVKHEEPNREARRLMKKLVNRRRRQFQTWWRRLERAGIDPKMVLLARQFREEARIVAGRERGQASDDAIPGDTDRVDGSSAGDSGLVADPAALEGEASNG